MNMVLNEILTKQNVFTINNCTLKKLEAYKELCNKYGIEYDLEEYNKYYDSLSD